MYLLSLNTVHSILLHHFPDSYNFPSSFSTQLQFCLNSQLGKLLFSLQVNWLDRHNKSAESFSVLYIIQSNSAYPSLVVLYTLNIKHITVNV